MKKFLILLPVILSGFFLLTGQSFENNSAKWNPDPRMTRIYTTGQYAPLPQNRDMRFSNEARIVTTNDGSYSISPSFRVHPSNNYQTETPITRHPTDPMIMFASANSFDETNFSTGVYVTTNGGVNWFGSDTLNNGTFSYGDPGPAIDRDGRFYMSYISLTGNIGTSYSTNNGITWSPNVNIPLSTTSSDKNFTTTDDVPSSPFYGRIYTAYTEFAPPNYQRIVISYSTNGGVSWSNEAPVSPVPSPNHFDLGVDLKVGPNGVLYLVWANSISNGQNSTEDSLGFAKSTDGGVSWSVSNSNAVNMNGIRAQNLFNGIRSNGYPRLDIDRTGGSRNGWIYAVTAEKFEAPATDVADAILHRSTDGGATWTSVRVNQDTPGNGKYQYFSAVNVDADGGVNVIYYDTRNTPTNDSAQIYLSRSLDGGNTWTDILISDHKFMPKPVIGTAQGYQGDYIGITSGNKKLWLYWCSDVTGLYQAWTAEMSILTYPLSAYNLTTPAPNSRVVTYPNSYIPFTFNWDTAASTAVYKWIFGNPTTSTRKITFESDTNSLTVLTGQMDSILASLGVAVGDSLVGQWDVWAFRNAVQNDSLSAANGPRSIVLKRGIPPLTSFNLYSPAAGTRIETSAFNSTIINFNWATSGPGVTYKWKFGAPTISNIKFSFTSNISGVDSSFAIPNYSMDAALATAGVLPGDSITGVWSVWAYNGFDSVKASQDNSISYKRQSQADVLVLYDSTNANCRISKDSVVANLTGLGYTNQLYNRKNAAATNSISFRGYKRVLVLGEGSNAMSTAIKDSIKTYLMSGTAGLKAKVIIMGEDIGYQFDRASSIYYDSAFCRSMCGFQYVADRPGPVAQRGLIGVSININIADSSNGPSMDVLRRSASVPPGQTYNLYRYRLFNDSMNAIGRVSPTYNVATFAFDVEALRPAFDSPNGLTVRRMLYGAISFVDEVPMGNEGNTTTEIPQSFSLSQNYPNPFNPVTVIRYSLSENRYVSLKIFDALGKEIAVLVNEKKDAGAYNVEFNAGNFASGIYFYQIKAGEFVETKRMMLLK